MKLINKDEDAPDIFYVFHNYFGLNGEINKWNFNLDHRIKSSSFLGLYDNEFLNKYLAGEVDYLPFKYNGLQVKSPSSFIMSTIHNYNIEHNLEYYRAQHFKFHPSRLSGIYAFGDYESCKLANKLYNWDLSSVKKFKLVEDSQTKSLIRIGKYNMEIVSLLRGINMMIFPTADQEQIYRNYWSGGGNIVIEVPIGMTPERRRISSGVLYEYLIEGILELIADPS